MRSTLPCIPSSAETSSREATSCTAALGTGLAVWLFAGSLTDLALKAGVGKASASVMLHRLRGLPGSVFGTALGHFGLGVTLLGIVAVTAFETENILTMDKGDTLPVAGYTLRFDEMAPVRGPNFQADEARFSLLSASGEKVADIASSKRVYNASRMPTTEAGIHTFVFSQLYVSLGDPASNGGMVVRVWYKPLVTLIWLGTVLMMFGGILSLADRRLRVGAPARTGRKQEQGSLEARA